MATIREIGHFIGGEALYAGGRRVPVMNPAEGVPIAEVFLADAILTHKAVSVASEALPAWSAMTPLRRARILFQFKDLLVKNQRVLADLIAEEHGKVFSDAAAEVVRGMEVVEFACGIPHLLKGEFSPNVGSGVDSWSLQQPVGVCVGISPFNFPCMVPMWMFPIALACGNTFILKPSEKDPSVTVKIAELLLEAGLPKGVFNVLQGDKQAVDGLLEDPRVAAVSFVGSTPVAQYIYAKASESGKRVQALGGAKNHMVIMPDADLDSAVDALVGSAFGAAGERCMAISCAVAVGGVADALSAKLLPRVKGLRIGSAALRQPEPDMGPLVTRAHWEKVCEYIEIGIGEGATLLADGRSVKVPDHEAGFFLGGTLFDKVDASMTIYRDEIFGPLLVIVRVKTLEDALALIEQNPYGNGAAIFTRDGGIAREFADRVTAGMVGINVPIPVPMAFHSFGGWKKSNFGPLNMHGMDGVRFYTRMKTVTARWPRSLNEGSGFVMPTH